MFPAVTVAHALESALARGERGPLIRGWLDILREAVGWLVREGVTNVIRHSRATYCRISAAGDGAGALVVTVVNDRPHASSGGGTGLRGLAERLGAVGGSLSGERAGDEFVLTATFTRESVIAS